MEYKNSVLEDLLNDYSNSIKGCAAEFPIYIATVAASISEEITELENFKSFLLKRIKAGIIIYKSLFLYIYIYFITNYTK